MKSWILVAGGISVYLSGLIAFAPATLIDVHLQHISAGSLHLAEARGTLWSGTGQMEIRNRGGRTEVAKGIAWRMVPLSLARGRLVYKLALEQAGQDFPVTLSLSDINLANADIRLPAKVLGLSIPRLAPLGLTGELLLHIVSFSFGHEQMSGNATVKWRNAGSLLTSVSPLGEYELSFHDEGAVIHGLLSTVQGPLRLDGAGSWGNREGIKLLVTAHVPPQHQQQLAPLLRLIAVERDSGKFEFQFK